MVFVSVGPLQLTSAASCRVHTTCLETKGVLVHSRNTKRECRDVIALSLFHSVDQPSIVGVINKLPIHLWLERLRWRSTRHDLVATTSAPTVITATIL